MTQQALVRVSIGHGSQLLIGCCCSEPQFERRTRREIHQPPDPYEAYQQELEAEIPEWEELRPVGQVVCAEHDNKQKTRIGHHMHGDDEGETDARMCNGRSAVCGCTASLLCVVFLITCLVQGKLMDI